MRAPPFLRRARPLALAALLAGALAGPAPAATVRNLPLALLAERSTLVFVGTVAAQHTRLEREPTQVITDTLFDVDQVLRGEKPTGPIYLSQLGGEAADEEGPVGQAVPGYARFEIGEEVVLFLQRAETGQLVVTGLAQGKYRVVTDPKSGARVAVRDLDGLHLVGGPQAWVKGAPDPNRLPLATLAALVRGEPLPAPTQPARTPTEAVVVPEVLR